jgi:hypothetical protein
MTPDELIALLRASGANGWSHWNMTEMLATLDKAGYAIVPKPVLRDRGAPHPRPS